MAEKLELSENGQKVLDHVKSVLKKAIPYGGNSQDTSVGKDGYLFVITKDNHILVHNLPLQADLDATGETAEEFNICLEGLFEKKLLEKKNLSLTGSTEQPLWYYGLPGDDLKANSQVKQAEETTEETDNNPYQVTEVASKGTDKMVRYGTEETSEKEEEPAEDEPTE